MKKLLKLAVCLVAVVTACQPVENKDSSAVDSLDIHDRNFDILNVPRSFAIGEELDGGTVEVAGRQILLRDFLPSLYIPDTLYHAQTGTPDFIITSVQILQGTFFSDSGKCQQRSLVLCTRGDYVDGEAYDLFFVALGKSNQVAVAGKQTFEGSHGKASTELSVSLIDLPADDKCSLLLVTSQSENGQEDLYRERWAEIFIASGRGFRPLLKLQLEETFIQDYEADRDGDDVQDTSSKVQKLEVLPSTSNELHDIKVTFELSENGVVVRKGSEIYRFDGQYYGKAE